MFKQVGKPASEIKVGDRIGTDDYVVSAVHIVGNTVTFFIKGLGTFTKHVREFVTSYVKEEKEG